MFVGLRSPGCPLHCLKWEINGATVANFGNLSVTVFFPFYNVDLLWLNLSPLFKEGNWSIMGLEQCVCVCAGGVYVSVLFLQRYLLILSVG